MLHTWVRSIPFQPRNDAPQGGSLPFAAQSVHIFGRAAAACAVNRGRSLYCVKFVLLLLVVLLVVPFYSAYSCH